MACLNMFNNEQHPGLYSTMSPRISFSNDFADPQQPIKLDNSYREAPVSSDFEFSVPNYTMISADELFFKGKMLPLRETARKRLPFAMSFLLAVMTMRMCRLGWPKAQTGGRRDLVSRDHRLYLRNLIRIMMDLWKVWMR
ncbi:UNVERIFIED_CONTAM: hypothetical protein Scaly_1368200 [Sesamum calycinum]|uniref:Uncharacterized protein n=1 Tax=Sesamum calycinum TaxID=2727403 RepID=A0AAW2PKU0_9LAMI